LADIATDWQECVGCLRLQVSFRKGTTNYRSLLQKETYNDSASYGSLPPSITYCITLTLVPYTSYGVATISRLLKIIGLFCKRALQKRRYSAKKTYHFKEATTRSHPILTYCLACVCMCVCVYIYKYMYIHIYVHICTYTYMHVCIYVHGGVRQ